MAPRLLVAFCLCCPSAAPTADEKTLAEAEVGADSLLDYLRRQTPAENQ